MTIRKNKHMTLQDRQEIESCPCHGMTFEQIAASIGKDQTTVSKEVSKEVSKKVLKEVSKEIKKHFLSREQHKKKEAEQKGPLRNVCVYLRSTL